MIISKLRNTILDRRFNLLVSIFCLIMVGLDFYFNRLGIWTIINSFLAGVNQTIYLYSGMLHQSFELLESQIEIMHQQHDIIMQQHQIITGGKTAKPHRATN